MLNDDAKVGGSMNNSKFFIELFADTAKFFIKLFANTVLILDPRQTLDFNHSVCFLRFYLAFCSLISTFAAKM